MGQEEWALLSGLLYSDLPTWGLLHPLDAPVLCSSPHPKMQNSRSKQVFLFSFLFKQANCLGKIFVFQVCLLTIKSEEGGLR